MTDHKAVSWLFSVSFIILLLTGSARADEPNPTVGILRIDTEGVSEAAAEQFEAEVEEALQDLDVTTVGSKKLEGQLADSEFVVGCTFGPCLGAVAALGIPLILVARIRGDGSSYHFVITLVDAKSGIHTSQVAQTCAVCTVEEAIRTATLATVALITGTGGAEVTDPAAGPTAEISLNGHKETAAPKLLRTSGLVFLGLGAAAVAVGSYYYLSDSDSSGGPLGVGTGVALASGGATMLLLSRRF